MTQLKWVTLHGEGFALPREIRQRVFVEEQGFTLEFDQLDARSLHLAVWQQGQPAACLRLYRTAIPDCFAIGRIAVLPPFRGSGLGSLCMQAAELRALRLGAKQLTLSAQQVAMEFYRKLGYTPVGEVYPDEGVPHIRMVKVLPEPQTQVVWCKPGEDYAHALALRLEVFGGEFGYTNDPDEYDAACHTLVLYREGAPVACGRIAQPTPGVYRLGKVVVRKPLRGLGLGEQVMENLEFGAAELGAQEVMLAAQLVARGFYDKLGYTPYDEVFDIQGKPHIKMKKVL